MPKEARKMAEISCSGFDLWCLSAGQRPAKTPHLGRFQVFHCGGDSFSYDAHGK
jgi:hypothetical protein